MFTSTVLEETKEKLMGRQGFCQWFWWLDYLKASFYVLPAWTFYVDFCTNKPLAW